MVYKVGQILTILTNDNDGRVIVGADNLLCGLRSGRISKIPDGIKVEGYDSEGLATFLIDRLKRIYPIFDMLNSYAIPEKEFQEEIECAFEELGLG